MRLIFILAALVVVYLGGRWLWRQNQAKKISHMSVEELVDAIIAKEISILEVPRSKRSQVESALKEIQQEIDRL